MSDEELQSKKIIEALKQENEVLLGIVNDYDLSDEADERLEEAREQAREEEAAEARRRTEKPLMLSDKQCELIEIATREYDASYHQHRMQYWNEEWIAVRQKIADRHIAPDVTRRCLRSIGDE